MKLANTPVGIVLAYDAAGDGELIIPSCKKLWWWIVISVVILLNELIIGVLLSK